MGKKIAKKKVASRKKTSDTTIIYRYISVGFAALLLIFVGKVLVSGATKVHVLGTSSGPILLADQGSGDSGSGGSGGSGSSGGGDTLTSGGSSGSSGSGSSGSGSSGSGSSNTSGGSDSQTVTVGGTSVSNDAQVDCVGPDGKHFTTSFHDCQELNQQWGHTNFSFTQLGLTQHGPDVHPTEVPHTEVQQEGNKGEFNLETLNSHIEIKQEDNGQVSIHAKQSDGTEVELKNNSLEDINKMLEDKGVEVSTDSATGLGLVSGGVHASSNFPLSFDPTTKALSITTPNGVRTIAVLPDQAVNAVLRSGIMTHVESQNVNDQTATATANLTELNNDAVFEVNGISEKKLLGVFPVGFAKTSFVSATTGQVVQTNESPLNKLLEIFSF